MIDAEKIKKWKAELEKLTGNDYSCCYQCGKCTAGCPVGQFMDNPPTLLMRLIQINEIEQALLSDSLWWCVGCGTCTARCPQNMEIAGTLDVLRAIALRENLVSRDVEQRRVEAFHRAFLNTIKKSGRLNEIALVNSYKIRTGTFLQDMDAGLKMMLNGKINPLSIITSDEKVNNIEQIQKIFELADTKEVSDYIEKRRPKKIELKFRRSVKIDNDKLIGYYPGCSLKGTAKEFDISTRKLCDLLDIRLSEIPDWNCCGASSAHATNHLLSLLLPARNQAIADKEGFDYVLTPCAACLNRQRIAKNALVQSKELVDLTEQIVGFRPTLNAEFISLTEMLLGMDSEYIKTRVVNPLSGLKLACYYGCLLVRPIVIMGFDDPENPNKMERLVEAIGAETVDWAFKIECCGAGLTMANPKLIEDLTHKIFRNASQAGAKAFVVACPMCHSNLDMRQRKMRKRFGDVPEMPVYYLSELIAIACGADPIDVAVNKHFTNAIELIR